MIEKPVLSGTRSCSGSYRDVLEEQLHTTDIVH